MAQQRIERRRERAQFTGLLNRSNGVFRSSRHTVNKRPAIMTKRVAGLFLKRLLKAYFGCRPITVVAEFYPSEGHERFSKWRFNSYCRLCSGARFPERFARSFH